MNKVVIKVLQDSVVTQTLLGGLTIYLPVTNFLQCIPAKNYENWMRVDKVIAVRNGWFFGRTPYFVLKLQLASLHFL